MSAMPGHARQAQLPVGHRQTGAGWLQSTVCQRQRHWRWRVPQRGEVLDCPLPRRRRHRLHFVISLHHSVFRNRSFALPLTEVLYHLSVCLLPCTCSRAGLCGQVCHQAQNHVRQPDFGGAREWRHEGCHPRCQEQTVLTAQSSSTFSTSSGCLLGGTCTDLVLGSRTQVQFWGDQEPHRIFLPGCLGDASHADWCRAPHKLDQWWPVVGVCMVGVAGVLVSFM